MAKYSWTPCYYFALIFLGDKKADIEAAKTSIILVLLYLMSWSPYAIVCLMTLVGSRDSLTPFYSELPVLFAKTSAVYNPIVYAVKHPKFRLEIEKRFPFLICCCPPKPKVCKTCWKFIIYPCNNIKIYYSIFKTSYPWYLFDTCLYCWFLWISLILLRSDSCSHSLTLLDK